MAFPLKAWRRWHRKVNLKQKRHALASALAATQISALVLARGHIINKVACLPVVLSNTANEINKTRDAV